MYWRSKKRKHKEANNDMKTYYENMKKIRGYEEDKKVKLSEKFEVSSDYISTQESRSTNEEEIQSNTFSGIGSRIVDISLPEIFEKYVEEESVCFNCHRTQHSFLKEKFSAGDLKTIYVMTFCHHNVGDIRRQRKFKSFDTNAIEDGILLCKECSNHLTKEDKETYNNVSNVWPAFMWSLLSNLKVQEAYGRRIWTFIPELWRYWWIGECTRLVPSLNNVSIRNPRAIFSDRTVEIH